MLNTKGFYILLGLQFAVRFIVALFANLSVDESYYTMYGLYPSWSYFDHPPMVGWLIKLSTLDYSWNTELSVRLFPLFIGTLNIYLIYLIGRKFFNPTVGLIAGLLCMASLYNGVILGVFVLPDTGQSLFWLLAIYFFLHYVEQADHQYILSFGLCVGLGMLAKYHSIFLLVGAGLYFLMTDWRKLFTIPVLLSFIIPMVMFIPILQWNAQYDWLSFNFHGDRVGNDSFTIYWDYFFQELGGQILYNNPISVFVVGYVIFRGWRWRLPWQRDRKVLFLLCTGLPLVVVLLFLSFFNKTLPHWSGPAYYSLFMVAAIGWHHWNKGIRFLIGGVGLLVVILGIGLAQVGTGFLPMPEHANPDRLGSKDFSLDLYGWDQLSVKFDQLVSEDMAYQRVDSSAVLYTRNWFPAGQIDYYLGYRSGRTLMVESNLQEQHHYYFVNTLRAKEIQSPFVYFIISSRYQFKVPEAFMERYQEIWPPRRIDITRGGKPVCFFTIYTFRKREK